MAADLNSVPMGFSFAGVKGTTAQTSAQFAVQDEKIAYVAGSGAIVATIGKDGKIRNQRLFVANASNDTAGSSYGYGYPKNQEIATCDDELRKDIFGFPLNHTYYYKGTCMETEIMSSKSSFESMEPGKNSSAGSKLKDKVRAPTCLAISPNGRVLAVGESGYMPRILLFSLAADSAAQPFAVIHEHSFGIVQIQFSPNSKYFCSLGTSSDGFLHVWKYSPTNVVRRAGNKCLSTVNDLLWHDTGSEFGDIITLGLRFLKIWSLDSKELASPSKGAVLKGRNIILGSFLESNFQSADSLGPDEILIKEQSCYYLLSLRHGVSIQQISLDHENTQYLVIDPTENVLWAFDRESKLSTLDLNELELTPAENIPPKSALTPSKMAPGAQKYNNVQGSNIIKAQMYGSDHIVYLTNDTEIFLHHKESKSPNKLVLPPVLSVVGGKRASTGEVLFFSKHGKVVSLMDSGNVVELATHSVPQAGGLSNELSAVEKCTSTLFLGDKYGSLTIIDLSESNPKTEAIIKAHSSTMNDIVYFEVGNVPLLCSISRDRMIQIYCKSGKQWDVLCTLPIHTANLLSVRFSGSNLFVCAADRSISVHEITKRATPEMNQPPVDIVHKKTITLKNTPLAMDISDTELVISCSDRSLSVYDKQSLEFKKAVKLYGENSTEALCVDRFLLLSGDQIVVFCNDRSLRLFNLSSGKHLNCVWGHLDMVIGIFENANHILSLGSDGSLFKWKLTVRVDEEEQRNDQENEDKPPTPDLEASPLFAKVTRKFLPTVQMSKLTLSPKRNSTLPSEDSSINEPDSPSPRLTSATLKRIEARKKAQTMNSSPTKPLPTQANSTRQSPFRSRSVSPPKSQQTSQTPFNKSPIPNRQTPLSRSLHIASKTPNLSSPQKGTAPSLPPPISSTAHAKERATAYIAMIKSDVKKDIFDEEDKKTLRKDLEEVLALLGASDTYDNLLEKYSNDLVSLVQKRLSDS